MVALDCGAAGSCIMAILMLDQITAAATSFSPT